MGVYVMTSKVIERLFSSRKQNLENFFGQYEEINAMNALKVVLINYLDNDKEVSALSTTVNEVVS